MIQFQLIFPVLFTLALGSSVDIPCTTRVGGPANGVGATSAVSCISGETLVSCGIKGTHYIGGARINPNDKNSCQVLSYYSNSAWPAYPEARCCRFPPGAIDEITDVVSNAGTLVSSTCPSNTVLTGCHVYFASGDKNQIKGSFSGNQGGPPQTGSWIDTGNKCTAQSRVGSSTVTARARCIKFSSTYSLTCKTKASFTSKDSFGQCQSGYDMFGCNTYTTSATLDSYYVNSADKCYVQQDDHKPQYANAICCQLAVTPTTKAPTTKAPTTKAPTTKAPTTKAPTTKAPTTKSPTPTTTETPMCCARGKDYPKDAIEKRLDKRCSKKKSEKKCTKVTDRFGDQSCKWVACASTVEDENGEYWIADLNDNNMLTLYGDYNLMQNNNMWIFGIMIILLACIIFGTWINRYKCSEYKQLDNNSSQYGSISSSNNSV